MRLWGRLGCFRWLATGAGLRAASCQRRALLRFVQVTGWKSTRNIKCGDATLCSLSLLPCSLYMPGFYNTLARRQIERRDAGTLSGILGDVASHLEITRDELVQRLFSR